jgi:hypothetical protein
MVEWWESLSVLGHIFAYIAIPTTIVMAVQIVMMLFGLGHSGDSDASGTDLHDFGGHDISGHDFSGHDIGGHDFGGHDLSGAGAHDIGAGTDLNGDGIPDAAGGHGDYHSDTAADSGFRLISFRSIIASLAIFGWTGLVMLRNGGYIVDTPGFSSFELDEIQYDELGSYYPDFGLNEENCRFTGCSHTCEPGCVVRASVEAGRIGRDRYNRYVELYNLLKLNDSMKYKKNNRKGK